MYEEYGITQEQYENILNEYGDVNYYTIQEYFGNLSIEISNEIKKEVAKNKEETTKFMDNTKLLFFIGLIAGYSYVKFSQKLDEEYEKYNSNTTKEMEKGFESVKELLGIEEAETEEGIELNLDELLEIFKLDTTSTKTADDKYIRLIKNYYKQMEKSTEYFKTDITLKEYLAKRVDKFDKLEKTVAYYNKDGTIRAYFDIASYDSMVYNTNLTRSAAIETIKACARLSIDVVYIDPHPFACYECQIWQGKFYSLTGMTTEYKGERVLPLEVAIEGESGIGLFHPNCSHTMRTALPEDRLSDKYSGEVWEENYDIKQKIQALELKKRRLRNDNKIYRELDSQEYIDENNKKIRHINERIKELKEQLNVNQ